MNNPTQPPIRPPDRTAPIRPPAARRLRGYSFDPSTAIQLETMGISEIVYKIPWDKELKKGPVGEYLEVVDYDPASQCFYTPIDLNNPFLIAQDGLQPSQGNPQFHQQMVYAVAMTTIGNFEQALGRKVLWRSHSIRKGTHFEETFVRRLRIYPHALREANAFITLPKRRYCLATSPPPATLRARIWPAARFSPACLMT
jgi:hypothetical protein